MDIPPRKLSAPEALLTPKQAAQVLNVSVSWLAKARKRGDGPRFVQIGRSIRYPESSLRDFIKARTRFSSGTM